MRRTPFACIERNRRAWPRLGLARRPRRRVEDGARLHPGSRFRGHRHFDSLYGHRRDVAGCAAALEAFEARLPELRSVLRAGDLVIIVADHGCDPAWRGTDHTREQVPILAFGPSVATGSIGQRQTFADVAATIAAHLQLPAMSAGQPF
jgi:phosphopentomutase